LASLLHLGLHPNERRRPELKNATVASPLYTTPEAAQYVALSPKTLEKLRCIGGGPEFVRLGGGAGGGRMVRYEREALDRWIARGRRRTTSDTPNAAAVPSPTASRTLSEDEQQVRERVFDRRDG
jgi:hypothetical protein